MLWIALFLSELPLQLAQRAQPTTNACVIADGPALRPLVRCANATALAAGIKCSMPIAAARALTHELLVIARNTTAEEQALHNLACWAGQFTPGITLQKEGLLLEVSTTLNMHGGLSRLLTRIGKGITELGYRAEPGIAPTPHAAWLLAKARARGMQVRMCNEIAQLPARLDALPLTLLDWPADELKTLHTLGIHRLGQCLQLPRDGFTQRFGVERQRELDMLLGSVADPRPWFMPPDSFASKLDFGFDLNDAMALLFPLKRLLQELEGFLRARGAGVQEWQLQLDHWNHRKTNLTFATVAPERHVERWLSLARERLSQLTLVGPVLALGISVDKLMEFAENTRSFIPDPQSRAIGWGHLIDKLSMRLGPDKVYSLKAMDDHRPEQAWQRREAMTAVIHARQTSESLRQSATVLSVPRPLWLLSTPRSLRTQAGQPLCQGLLNLIAGPERIEAGWWDGKRVHRDYYVARNAQGETFWIYREHEHNACWYLHGVFA